MLSALRNFLTVMPTPTGPIIVQSTTAHMITRKMSWFEEAGPELVEAALCTVRVPALDDSEAIKKPISPRATMANDIIAAGTCGADSSVGRAGL